MPIIPCTPLTEGGLVVEGKWRQSFLSVQSETVDGPGSFKSDMWKNYEQERRQKTIRRQCRTRTNTYVRHILVQSVTFKD